MFISTEELGVKGVVEERSEIAREERGGGRV